MIVRCCLLVALAAYAQAVDGFDDDIKELAKMLRESCASETNVNVALIDQINAGADIMDDTNLKCYIKCTMETAGMLSEGVVDVEAVLAVLPEDLRKRNQATIRGCGTKSGADDCDTAYKTQQCWQQGNKKDFFML